MDRLAARRLLGISHMGPPPSPENEVWDLDQLRFPAELVGDVSARRRPPRHRPGDPFIKGPIPYAWIASACRLPGSGLHVAMACRFLCGRYRAEPMGSGPAVVPIARAAPRARQGALPMGLRVAVHHLGPLLLRSKRGVSGDGTRPREERPGLGRRSEWRRRQARTTSAFLGVEARSATQSSLGRVDNSWVNLRRLGNQLGKF